MKRQSLLILSAVLLLAANSKEEDAAKKELEKLQGTWVLTAVDVAGKRPAAQDVTSDARRE